MKSIGVRQLKEHMSEMLRLVQEGETVEVTKRGEVIARVVPAHGKSSPDDLSDEEVWTDLERLSLEISKHWPEGLSAVDAVREARREL